MVKKKGFTLIELLAVIVILGIVLAVAIPSISNVIDNAKLQAFVENEQMMIKAAKTYIGINDNLPVNIGDTIEIKLSDLQYSNYISTIKDPSNKNVTCNGYVLVTKINSNTYDYTPFLKCNEGIIADGYITDGLVGYWKLDGNAYDYTPNNNHGIIYGATPTADRFGIANKAMSFNGNYIDYGNTDYNYQEFTVSIWAKSPTNISSDPNFPIHVTNLIGKGNWNSTSDWFIGYKSSNTNPATDISFVYGIIWNSGPSYSVNNFKLDEWNNFVGVADSTSQKLYLNGILVSSVNISHLSVTNTYNLQIARSSYCANTFKGNIDNIHIYNRALSVSEVKHNYDIEKSRNW